MPTDSGWDEKIQCDLELSHPHRTALNRLPEWPATRDSLASKPYFQESVPQSWNKRQKLVCYQYNKHYTIIKYNDETKSKDKETISISSHVIASWVTEILEADAPNFLRVKCDHKLTN